MIQDPTPISMRFRLGIKRRGRDLNPGRTRSAGIAEPALPMTGVHPRPLDYRGLRMSSKPFSFVFKPFVLVAAERYVAVRHFSIELELFFLVRWLLRRKSATA